MHQDELDPVFRNARREALFILGLYAVALVYTVTYCYLNGYGRAVEIGLRPHVIDRVVMRRRIHSENMGRRLRVHRRDYLRILKRTIDRRQDAASAVPARGGTEPPDGSA